MWSFNETGLTCFLGAFIAIGGLGLSPMVVLITLFFILLFKSNSPPEDHGSDPKYGRRSLSPFLACVALDAATAAVIITLPDFWPNPPCFLPESDLPGTAGMVPLPQPYPIFGVLNGFSPSPP